MLLLGSLPLKKSETSLTILGTADKDDFMDVALVDLGLVEDLDRPESDAEEVLRQSSLKRARAREVQKSVPSKRESISVWKAESVRSSRSRAVRRRRTTRRLVKKSFLCLVLNSWMK